MLTRGEEGQTAGRGPVVERLHDRDLELHDPTLTVSLRSGEPGVHLVGEVDLYTRYDWVEILRDLPATGGDVHLHLDDVTFVDVAGARALVEAAGRLGPGRMLVLHRPPRALVLVLDRLWGRADGITVVES